MRRRTGFLLVIGWAGLLDIQGCGHTQAPVAATTTHAPQSVAPAAPQPQRPEVPRTAADEPPPITTDSIESFMLEHFLISTWARDAIVDGDLEAIREPLFALSAYSYDTVAPGGWMKGIAQMQAAARLTAQAETIAAAASGIAAMGRTCGQCHREQGGPEVQHYRVEKAAPKSDSLDTRMLRHAWAVERLWEGLTAPSDDAWMAGAAVLVRAPAAAPEAQPALSKEVSDTLERVRELGSRAARADSAEAREQVYGALLVTCAQCHRSAPQILF